MLHYDISTEMELPLREASITSHTTTNISPLTEMLSIGSQTPAPVRLLELPNEIITHIFGFLHEPPPSFEKSLSKPEYNLTFSPAQPLKNLSLTNTRLRYLTVPILFRHARLDPYYLGSFLSFVTRSNVSRHISTVTAQLQGPCNHIHLAWWSRLLETLPNLSALIVLAAPHVFAELGQVAIETSHSWAFKIPYHTMTLSYNPTVTAQSDSLPKKPAHETKHNLLTVQPWTSLTFNESSHLPAYSTYEYFLKTPPSLLASLYSRLTHRLTTTQPPTTQIPKPIPTPQSEFLTNLLSFTYIAIFPFYNHVDEILKTVRQMTRLQKLFVKLCPEPESSALQDELDHNNANAGRTEGRIDVNDPWNEFETSYTLIPHTIIYLTTDGSLSEFQTDDVKMTGVRDTLIEIINQRLDGLGCWAHTGDGIWRRNMAVRLGYENGDQDGSVVETGAEMGAGAGVGVGVEGVTAATTITTVTTTTTT